jgi:5-methyltetrahydropteroyltriglutamate--homocysteine methyltransferase
VQPSASLQHVPYDATVETKLPSALRQVLAFAFQKLKEVDLIARLIKKGICLLLALLSLTALKRN